MLFDREILASLNRISSIFLRKKNLMIFVNLLWNNRVKILFLYLNYFLPHQLFLLVHFVIIFDIQSCCYFCLAFLCWISASHDCALVKMDIVKIDIPLTLQRPKFLRPNGKIYQAINVDTLRAQNMETWPYFNQVLARANHSFMRIYVSLISCLLWISISKKSKISKWCLSFFLRIHEKWKVLRDWNAQMILSSYWYKLVIYCPFHSIKVELN